MKVDVQIRFLNENGRFFGQGPYQLLLLVEKYGSLRSAAQHLEMSYSKALHLIKQAEDGFGFALIERSVGGKHGGGSVLTAKAKQLLECYKKYRCDCEQSCNQLFQKHFSDLLFKNTQNPF